MSHRKRLRALVAAILISLATCEPASAQSDAPAVKPHAAHGGDLRLAGPLWLELVVAKGTLAVYVMERTGKAVNTVGGKGQAGVHTDGKATQVDLQPAGENRLEGHAKFSLKATTVVFVTIDLQHEKPHRAVFRPLSANAAKH